MNSLKSMASIIPYLAPSRHWENLRLDGLAEMHARQLGLVFVGKVEFEPGLVVAGAMV